MPETIEKKTAIVKPAAAKHLAPNVKVKSTFGDQEAFKLISRYQDFDNGVSRSIRALEIHGVGCLVQVFTQAQNEINSSLTFIPGVTITEDHDENGACCNRQLMKM